MPYVTLSKKSQKTVHKKDITLFINQGALGDQLLALPLLSALNNKVIYSGRGIGLNLIESLMPFQVINLDQPPLKIKQQLQKESISEIVSVGSLDWLEYQESDYLNLSTNPGSNQPIWKQWGQSVLKRELQPFYFPNLKIAPKPHLIISPGSGSPKKNWASTHYRSLIQKLKNHFKITLLFGPTEMELNSHLLWNDIRHEIDFSLNPSSNELIELYSNATHYLGNDSGPGHLASVFNLKGAIIFISSNSKVWAPYGEALKCFSGPSLCEDLPPYFMSLL